jgi:MOSC domain-containing protein YiiM
MGNAGIIDSDSVGEEARFLALGDLERRLEALPASPTQMGAIALLVRSGPGGVRETPDRVWVTPEGGVPGHAWARAQEPDPDAQLAVMQADVAGLIANGQPLPLFGDNLFLDLDLSTANLPPGSRVRAGAAILEVTPVPHNGCRKFRSRFGEAALRFVSRRDLRPRNLRGIYMRVIEAGEIGPGDSVEVLSRASIPDEPGGPQNGG